MDFAMATRFTQSVSSGDAQSVSPGLVQISTLESILSAIETSWLFAGIVVVVAWYVSKLVADRLRPALERRVLRPTTANMVLRFGRVVVVVVALVPFAGLLGFRPQNVLLSFTVISVVIGAILAPVARSYVSGFFILFNRPYEIGDVIELVDEDERGYVDDITLGYTEVSTLENSFLIVPNETMRERDVRNLSAGDERNWASIDVLVTYEGDLEATCDALESAARSVDGVIGGGPRIRIGSSKYPAAPTVFVREFADHGILLELRCWIEAPTHIARVQSDIRRTIYDRLADIDAEFAYPHTHHVFDEASGRARVALDPIEQPDRPHRRDGATTGTGRDRRHPSERSPGGSSDRSLD